MKKGYPNRLFSQNASQFVNNLLVEADSVLLQGKHVVSKDHDLIVSPLMELNEKLASAELIGVHRIKQDALLCLDGHILSVELWRHWAPHLKHNHGYIVQIVSLIWNMLFVFVTLNLSYIFELNILNFTRNCL